MTVSLDAAFDFSRSVGVLASSCAFLVVVIANLAAPFGVQIVVRTLGEDVVRGDFDPLTGLLSRRAFYREAYALATEQAISGEGHLCVAMVDLDRFKRLNDDHGHGRGDEALVRVGAALRSSLGARAILGRVGGEEFLVAEVLPIPRPGDLGARLCQAIADISVPATASVGTAMLGAAQRDGEKAFDMLVTSADAAMYLAKRGGGNQTRSAVIDPGSELGTASTV